MTCGRSFLRKAINIAKTKTGAKAAGRTRFSICRHESALSQRKRNTVTWRLQTPESQKLSTGTPIHATTPTSCLPRTFFFFLLSFWVEFVKRGAPTIPFRNTAIAENNKFQSRLQLSHPKQVDTDLTLWAVHSIYLTGLGY